ncbi:MAG: hypothetical protein ACK5Z5_05750 [Neisseriaceae bacterium]|jgi:hypothetical protein
MNATKSNNKIIFLKRFVIMLSLIFVISMFIQPAHARGNYVSISKNEKYTSEQVVQMIKDTDAGISAIFNKLVKQHQTISTSEFSRYVTVPYYAIQIVPNPPLNLENFVNMANVGFINGFSDFKHIIAHIQIYGSTVVSQGLVVFYADPSNSGENIPVLVFGCVTTYLIDDGKTKEANVVLTQINVNSSLTDLISDYINNPSKQFIVDVNYPKKSL